MKPSHGHIYVSSEKHGLVAYEYRRGRSSESVASINHGFFQDLVQYLSSNNLAHLLGLEVLDDTSIPPQQMVEFVLSENGTVMVNAKDAKCFEITRVTGWSFAQDTDGTISCKGTVTHASKPGGPHKNFTDGKPLTHVGAVVDFLAEEEMIRKFC